MDLRSIGQKTCEYFPSVCEKFVGNSEQTVGVMAVVAGTVAAVALGYLLNRRCSRESVSEMLARRGIEGPRENAMQEMERIGEELEARGQQLLEWQRELKQRMGEAGN